MKYLICIMWCVCTTQLVAQTAYWRDRICKQEKFSKKDSINFCHVFDSLNYAYDVRRIVRIEASKNRFIPFVGNSLSFKDTLYLFDYWVEELSHAVQFSERRAWYKFRACFESARILYRYIFFNKRYRYRKEMRVSLNSVYQSLYESTHSFEYEAHEIIEPVLRVYIMQRLKNAPS